MTIRLCFVDFWTPFSPTSNWFYGTLSRFRDDVVIDEVNPTHVIFSVFGKQHLKFKDRKDVKLIHYTGENAPPITYAHKNLTFYFPPLHENFRLPLWILYFNKSIDYTLTPKKDCEFCCFVYSNNVPFRNRFAIQLSKYKKVSCAGKARVNNTGGGRLPDKLAFQRKFKFCIAYENSTTPGYTTEKILQAYESNCIPIYYGSDKIHLDFNPDTFINAHNFKSNKDLIDYIIKVDNDPILYNSYMNKPIFSPSFSESLYDPESNFYKSVCDHITS